MQNYPECTETYGLFSSLVLKSKTQVKPLGKAVLVLLFKFLSCTNLTGMLTGQGHYYLKTLGVAKLENSRKDSVHLSS